MIGAMGAGLIALLNAGRCGDYFGTQDAADLAGRQAHAAARAMHQQPVTLFDVQQMRPGQRRGRGGVSQRQGNRRREIQPARQGKSVDLARYRPLGQPAPIERGDHLVAGLEAGHAGADLDHVARHFGAGREREGRFALVFAGDQQRGAERHAGGAVGDTDLVGRQSFFRHVFQGQIFRPAPAAAHYCTHDPSIILPCGRDDTAPRPSLAGSAPCRHSAAVGSARRTQWPQRSRQ